MGRVSLRRFLLKANVFLPPEMIAPEDEIWDSELTKLLKTAVRL